MGNLGPDPAGALISHMGIPYVGFAKPVPPYSLYQLLDLGLGFLPLLACLAC